MGFLNRLFGNGAMAPLTQDGTYHFPDRRGRAHVSEGGRSVTLNGKKYTEQKPLDLSEVPFSENLENLHLSAGYIASLAPLERYTALNYVCAVKTHTDHWGSLPKVTVCMLDSLPLQDISGLASWKSLEMLSLTSMPVPNLEFLVFLPNFKALFIEECDLRDVTPLAQLRGLKALGLYNNPQLGPLHPLRALTELEELSVGVAPDEDDIPCIEGKEKVQAYLASLPG